MKYLPLAGLTTVTNALNFSTPDCHVIGGCDVYATKAAGSDKKLYKSIDNSLETQYQSLVRLSASLSPPYIPPFEDGQKEESMADGLKTNPRRPSVAMPDIDLSRASPFGPLSKTSARRTYAYLIATLNASHPDYDFSNTLRPMDFKKEPSLRRVMYKIESTLQNLRPHKHSSPPTAFLAPLAQISSPSANNAGGDVWGPKMWSLLDKEMGLRHCELYCYAPEDDPFEGEDGAIWSMHYLFYNKDLKRVCYLHFRALSVISHSPLQAPVYHRPKTATSAKSASISIGAGAGKRASYWLGDRGLQNAIDTDGYGPDDDDDETHSPADGVRDDSSVIPDPGDDEIDVPTMNLDDIRSDIADGHFSYTEPYYYGYGDDGDEIVDDSAFEGEGWHRSSSDGAYRRTGSVEMGAGHEMDMDM